MSDIKVLQPASAKLCISTTVLHEPFHLVCNEGSPVPRIEGKWPGMQARTSACARSVFAYQYPRLCPISQNISRHQLGLRANSHKYVIYLVIKYSYIIKYDILDDINIL